MRSPKCRPTGERFSVSSARKIGAHGHLPFVGRRRAVMFNWMRSEMALAKNVGRHRVSSMFKKILGAKHKADAKS